mmetsp:Transcript_6358/g.18685  ORF Transcript_6358/g.18685 Transcript_6358/m.18685 type:complete len:248 (+) Transcript_6358:449-1192(+)
MQEATRQPHELMIAVTSVPCIEVEPIDCSRDDSEQGFDQFHVLLAPVSHDLPSDQTGVRFARNEQRQRGSLEDRECVREQEERKVAFRIPSRPTSGEHFQDGNRPAQSQDAVRYRVVVDDLPDREICEASILIAIDVLVELEQICDANGNVEDVDEVEYDLDRDDDALDEQRQDERHQSDSDPNRNPDQQPVLRRHAARRLCPAGSACIRCGSGDNGGLDAGIRRRPRWRRALEGVRCGRGTAQPSG